MICHHCVHEIKEGQAFVSFKEPGKDGKFDGNYLNFHHRYQGDCWDYAYHKEMANHPVPIEQKLLETGGQKSH